MAGHRIRAAGFGVAGAVVEGQLHANNLPWTLDLPALARQLDVSPNNIVLLNDVVATAWGLDQLPANDLAVVNQGVLQPKATRALMAVGTGLGEALLVWDGRQTRVFPSEGGLAGFAPRSDREIQLLIHLKKQLPQVCCEDVLSEEEFAQFMSSWIPTFAIHHLMIPRRTPRVILPSERPSTLARFVLRRWTCGPRPTAPRPGTWQSDRWLLAAFTSRAE